MSAAARATNSARRKRQSNSESTESLIIKKQTLEQALAPELTAADSNGDEVCKDKKTEPADTSVSGQTRLTCDFYDTPCEDLCKALLGKLLVRRLDCGQRVSGVIVETEAYLGGEDHASHSYRGKKTARTEPMFMAPGTAYVYHIYGMYTCFNISSRGDGAAVLLRGLEAAEGADTMRASRGAKHADGGAKLKPHQLCNGPSKLTQALSISKDAVNKQDLTVSPDLWIEDGETVPDEQIVRCPRIGIKCAEEWEKAPLRFYIRKRPGVSIVNKTAETLMASQ